MCFGHCYAQREPLGQRAQLGVQVLEVLSLIKAVDPSDFSKMTAYCSWAEVFSKSTLLPQWFLLTGKSIGKLGPSRIRRG